MRFLAATLLCLFCSSSAFSQKKEELIGILRVKDSQFILQLPMAISVEDNSQGKISSSEIQLIGYDKADAIKFTKFVGKTVSVPGIIRAAHLRDHRVSFTITVQGEVHVVK